MKLMTAATGTAARLPAALVADHTPGFIAEPNTGGVRLLARGGTFTDPPGSSLPD